MQSCRSVCVCAQVPAVEFRLIGVGLKVVVGRGVDCIEVVLQAKAAVVLVYVSMVGLRKRRPAGNEGAGLLARAHEVGADSAEHI